METTSRLVIVRHGQSTANLGGIIGGHTPSPLTELGRAQAAATGERLAAEDPARIISSDLVRARQTAEHIAAVCDLPVEEDPRIRERSLGKFDGMLMSDFEAHHPEVYEKLMSRSWEYTVPSGESSSEMYNRVGAAMREWDDLPGKTVIVSHGIAIYFMLMHVLGLGVPNANTNFFALVDNCSITRIDKTSRWWRVHSLNERHHLPAG